MLSGCRILFPFRPLSPLNTPYLSPLNTPYFTDGGRTPDGMESDSLTEKAVFSPSETFLLNSWITYRLGGQKARESPENAFFAILPYSDTLPGLGGGVPHHVEGCSRARIVPTAKTADLYSLLLLLMAPAYVLPLAVIEDSRTPESIQDGESLLLPVWYFRGY